jgi:hypothetical protein
MLLAGAATVLRASAQPAPTATPVILVPPTRTPAVGGDQVATTTAQATPQLLRDATRVFPPTNTPRPTAPPPPTATAERPLSKWRWPYVGGLTVEPGTPDGGVFRVAMGMLRVRAAHVRGAERVLFFISANGQPPTILGIDTDLSDGASVPWLMLSREMDALITAVAANETRASLPALPIRAVFAGD